MKQKQAEAILRQGANVYLTGQAGSGKTYLLNKYVNHLRSRGAKVGITASTGIAATHLGGMTIHAWSGIGIRDELTSEDVQQLEKRGDIIRRLRSTPVLVIDEISMLHAHQLDMVDEVARTFRDNDEPFGGMQVVLSGDLFQLPPVQRSGNPPARFVPESDVWQTMDLTVCYLSEQYRQDDERHTRVLNAIRSGTVDGSTRSLLHQRRSAEIPNVPGLTRLHTHNVDVDAVNQRELQRIEKPEKRYIMETDGPKGLVEALKKGCLAPAELTLKEDALVMFTKNNFDAGYVNGTSGYVSGFTQENRPVVQTVHGDEVVANPAEWTLEDGGVVRATIRQIPLRLAWAITVHKSQGMSLDVAEMDLSKCFEPGMGYVALSRVRTLDGIRLLGLNDMALKVNDDVLAMDVELQRQSREAERGIDNLSHREHADREFAFLQKIGVKPENPEESSGDQSQDGNDKAYSVAEIRKEHPSAYKKWTRKEEMELIKAYQRGSSIEELAERHGRKPNAIGSRIRKLKERGWFDDAPEIEESGKVPRLVHALKAKLVRRWK